MKVLFVFGIVLVMAIYVAADDWKEKLHAARDHCQADSDTKIDDSTLEKLKNREISDWKLVDKYVACIATQTGFLDADGKINVETCRKALQEKIQDRAKVEEAIKECVVDQESPGKTAFVGMGCIRKYIGEQDVFIK